MSYKVLISDHVKSKIASWQLPRELHLEVYQRLTNDLAADPDKRLGERIVPLAYFAYSFVLIDHQRMPHQHAFLFAVDRWDDKLELHVVDCRHTTEDMGQN